MKMKKWVVKWLMQRQMRKRGFAGYEPYVFFEMQQGDYQLKIAKTDEEVLECLELRKKVFGDELGAQIKNQVDWDGFDVYFDHLYVRDLKSRQVVGTYRLRYSKANEACYTHSLGFFVSPRGTPSMAQLQRASPLAIHGAEASGRRKNPGI
jgi:putative hemolysin